MEVQNWFTNLTADYRNMIDIVRHTDFSVCAFVTIKGNFVDTETTVILGSQIVDGKTFTHFISNAWINPVYFVGLVLGTRESQRVAKDNVPHVWVVLGEREWEMSLDTLYKHHPAACDSYNVIHELEDRMSGEYSNSSGSSEDENVARVIKDGEFFAMAHTFSLYCPVAERPVFILVDSLNKTTPWLSGRDRDGVYCARNNIRGTERIVTLGQLSIYRSQQETPSFVTKDPRGAESVNYHGKRTKDCACCTRVDEELTPFPTIEVSKRKPGDPNGLYHVWVRVRADAVVSKHDAVFPYDTDNMPPLSEQQFDPRTLFGEESIEESEESFEVLEIELESVTHGSEEEGSEDETRE